MIHQAANDGTSCKVEQDGNYSPLIHKKIDMEETQNHNIEMCEADILKK